MRVCRRLLVGMVSAALAGASWPAGPAVPGWRIAPDGDVAAASTPGTVPDAYVAAPAGAELLPAPKEIRPGPGRFTLTPSTRIVVAGSATDQDLFAARELTEELRALSGPALRVVRAGEVVDPSGQILIGEPAAHALLRAAVGRSGAEPVTAAQGYLLQVTPAGVLVAGADRAGTFYGVQTLRQLLRPSRGRTLEAMTIRDWPDHAVRAVHVLLDRASDPLHIELIDRILAPHKINTLIVEAEHVQWESGRMLWAPDERGATKAQARRLLEAAREHHIQVIPLIATLGHSEWVFAGLRDPALCPQVAYIPKRLRDEGRGQVTCDRSRGVFPAVYDPDRQITVEGATTTLNQALIIPILREAIDLFAPQYLHLGHDEVRGPSGLRYDMDLYLRDVITLADVLRASRVRPMIWGDVLWERRTEAERDAQFRNLPRDMVVAPWKYEDVRDYPEVRYFKDAGFDVLGTTWYRLQNNFYFSRAARAAGALGMIRATWTGQFQNSGALDRAYRQLYTYLSAASYFWNSDRPAPERFPREAALARRFAELWHAGAADPAPVPGALLDLRATVNQSYVDNDGRGWLGKGPDYDLRALRPGRQRFGGILFEVLDPAANSGKSIVMLRGERDVAAKQPMRVTLRWSGRAACLAFLHTALDRAPSFGDVIGRYTITLAGGRQVGIDVTYGRNINSWLWDADRGIAAIDHEVAWTGTTRAGNDVYLQTLRWRNPEPTRVITAIQLASRGERASPVVFAITALERCP
jgi:hexosaminidase